MDKSKQIPKRQYTDEFKVEAVRLSESIGGNQAAKRLGVPDSSIWNWIRLSRAGKLKARASTNGQNPALLPGFAGWQAHHLWRPGAFHRRRSENPGEAPAQGHGCAFPATRGCARQPLLDRVRGVHL